jgi:hypothetical protein
MTDQNRSMPESIPDRPLRANIRADSSDVRPGGGSSSMMFFVIAAVLAALAISYFMSGSTQAPRPANSPNVTQQAPANRPPVSAPGVNTAPINTPPVDSAPNLNTAPVTPPAVQPAVPAPPVQPATP